MCVQRPIHLTEHKTSFYTVQAVIFVKFSLYGVLHISVRPEPLPEMSQKEALRPIATAKSRAILKTKFPTRISDHLLPINLKIHTRLASSNLEK